MVKFFCFTKFQIFYWAHQPPVQWVLGGPFRGNKNGGRENDHLPLSSTNVKNARICTSAFPYAFVLCTSKTLPFYVYKNFRLPNRKIRSY